jgi:hypothetical protein
MVVFSSLIAAAMSKLENSFLRNPRTVIVMQSIVVDYKITVFTKTLKVAGNKVQTAETINT